MSTSMKRLADKLPFGAGREIARRLAERGEPRTEGHISLVLSGKDNRSDPIVEEVARELIKEKWTRSYSRSASR